jgi:hypothetical protein
MSDLLARVWEHLSGRIDGPLAFRLVVQPLVAGLLGIRAGLWDARSGRPAYFWTLLTSPGERVQLWREGWKAVGRVMAFAALMDVAYQLLVFGGIYPLETVFIAFLLAGVPYLLTRGPVNRIVSMRHWRHRFIAGHR